MNSSTRTDVNLKSFYQARKIDLTGLDLAGANLDGIATPLKLSHSIDVSGIGIRSPQGLENALDINVCENVKLGGKFGGGIVEGDQVVTVKGGSKNIELSGLIAGHGNRSGVHIEIGNHSDQSTEPTKNVVLDFDHEMGGPVYVSTGWVAPFSVKLHGKCKWAFVASMELKAYVFAKLIVRKILGIQIGVKGPAWI